MAETAPPSDQPPLQAGQIRFYQAAPPAMPPGDYTLTVTQTLSGGKGDRYEAQRGTASDSFRTDSPFAVAGPRFYLKPSEIYSVYPPKGDFGPHDNALPQVVFTRRTLPWERTLDGAPLDPDNPVPWMALLSLSPGDFADGKLPKVTASTVADLLAPPAGTLGPQGLRLEYGEDGKDLCNTLDLPIAVFAEICPSAEDLPFLAHVREVRTAGKETLSLKQDGWFTVVLGNRMPETTTQAEGIPNLVCLVSLEGFRDHLPVLDANATPKVGGAGADTAQSVRLAVLASWQFTCYGHNDFKVRMTDLDDRSLLSLGASKLPGTTDGEKAVNTAFDLGYAALNHTTRTGEKTVSWYRGPLIPLRMPPRSPYAFIPSADRALRYDDTGMFAAEYAAAYELGRLLALQNRAVTSAMARYRSSVKLAQTRAARRLANADRFGVTDLKKPGDTFEDVVAALFETSKGLG
ncbi:hypothetical protein [Tropicibacter oceani]|uniref:Uncharacterized protein n=1 Tax=Tropicibacter oceani TaxID=3058420 RepID=A0ABY8QE89_9RHOB|nr:hypothetical protein [Tropicibacter oceani]WGW02910.1 hypothetical protein QF118_13305 [Tropicibacter oceani]